MKKRSRFMRLPHKDGCILYYVPRHIATSSCGLEHISVVSPLCHLHKPFIYAGISIWGGFLKSNDWYDRPLIYLMIRALIADTKKHVEGKTYHNLLRALRMHLRAYAALYFWRPILWIYLLPLPPTEPLDTDFLMSPEMERIAKKSDRGER